MTVEAPAWGTPPPAPSTTRFTVVGFYLYNGQRFCEHVTALSARDAEDLVRADLGRQRAVDGTPTDPQVCGVLSLASDGQIRSMDSYAFYLDPDRPEDDR